MFVIGFMYHLFDSTQWSEGEFRDAVHEAAQQLEAEPGTLVGHLGYRDLIEEAVQETGQGPEHTVIDVEPINDSDATGAVGSVCGGHGLDTFEISTDDVVTTYCMRMSPPQPETDLPSTKTVTLTVNVREGPC
ncbi:hypothetical protein [Streptomyces sp. NPDC002187]|uniref:hypothetical protein n=1 Tax=Streptomyces sp. NPDC002187 TaxID=3364637 RepID=UPI0036BBE7F4